MLPSALQTPLYYTMTDSHSQPLNKKETHIHPAAPPSKHKAITTIPPKAHNISFLLFPFPAQYQLLQRKPIRPPTCARRGSRRRRGSARPPGTGTGS